MASRLEHRARMLGRLATAWGRPGPDFPILGAQKGRLGAPGDGASSAYHDQRGRGREPLSFGAALDREAVRVGDEYRRLASDPGFVANPYRHYSYAGWGRYAEHLEPFLRLFGRERIL